jgi:hypothetical protein
MYLREIRVGTCELDESGSEQGPKAGSCKLSNKTSGLIKMQGISRLAE